MSLEDEDFEKSKRNLFSCLAITFVFTLIILSVFFYVSNDEEEKQEFFASDDFCVWASKYCKDKGKGVRFSVSWDNVVDGTNGMIGCFPEFMEGQENVKVTCYQEYYGSSIDEVWEFKKSKGGLD